MIPLRLKLHKSLGIWEGLKQETIEIDFTQFSPGLVVIYGASGTGKSTIQQNMHPFRSVGNFTFKDEFKPDGYREFEFEYNGSKYLSQVYVEKALLFKNGIFINRNKKENRTDYDWAVEEEFGNYDTFLNLAYGGRNFTTLIQLGNADMKSLFVDYLLQHLSKYKEYGEKLKKEYDDTTKKLVEISTKLTFLNELKQKKGLIEEEIKVLKIDIESLKEEIQSRTLLYEKYLIQEKHNKEIENQIGVLKKQKGEAGFKLNAVRMDIDFKTIEFNAIAQEWLELENLKLPEVIEIDTLKVQEKIQENNKAIQEAREVYGKLLLRNQLKRKEKEDLEKQLKELVTLPCTTELQLQCPFTKNKALNDYKESILKKLVDLPPIELEIGPENTSTLALENETLNTQLQKYTEYLKIKSQLDKKDELAKNGKKYRDEIIPKLNSEKDNFIKEIKILEEQISALENNYLNDIENPSETLNDLKVRVSKLEGKLETSEKQIIEIESEIQTLKDLSTEEMKLQKEIDEYPLLLDFFGNNGGMVYEIERAGEEVSRVTNELLKTYHNKNIQIKFETLRPSADGKKLIEVFDVMFSCNGSEWKYRLSEGEMVIASTALREAMNYVNPNKTLKSLMVDELDGSLDVNARIDYLKLLEEGHNLNNRKYTFLISHMSEIQDRMMQQIHLNENTITLKY